MHVQGVDRQVENAGALLENNLRARPVRTMHDPTPTWGGTPGSRKVRTDLAIRIVLITTFSKDAGDKSSIIRDIRLVQTKRRHSLTLRTILKSQLDIPTSGPSSCDDGRTLRLTLRTLM